MIAANHLTGDKPQATTVTRVQTCDCVKKATIVANHLKNLAGETWNMNESKINLDS